jgi:hypothetical protein
MAQNHHHWTMRQLKLLQLLWEGGATRENITRELAPHPFGSIKAAAYERGYRRPRSTSRYLALVSAHVPHDYTWRV